MDERLEYCQACLSSGRKLRSLSVMQSLLEFLALDELKRIQGGICWECLQGLKKFTDFKHRIQKTQELLRSNLQGPKLDSLSSLSIKKNASLEYYCKENSTTLEKLPAQNESQPDTNVTFDVEIKQEIEEDLNDGTYSDDETKDIFEETKDIFAKTKENIAKTKEIYSKTKEIFAERKEILTKAKDKFEETKDTFNETQENWKENPIIYVDVLKTTVNKTTKKKSQTQIELEEEEVMKTFKKVVFTEEEMLKSREEKRSQPNYKKIPYKCDSCVLGFTKKDTFDLHMEKKHSESAGEFSCPVCAVRFTTEKQVERHKNKHYSVYRCRMCDYDTLEKWSAAVHGRAKHRDFDKSREESEVHTKMEHFLRCGQCGEKLKSKNSLKSHMRRVHKVKREFICDICSKTFTTKSRLEVHLLSHDPNIEKKLSYCAQCNVQYKNIYIYRNHLRSSAGHTKGGYECEVCNKFFASKAYLKCHKDFYHLNKSKFYCQPCDKIFMSMWRLRNHRQTQHGESRTKEHSCNVCGKAFYTRSSLRDHLLTHSSARSYMCEECGDTFKQRPCLYTHCRLVHKQIKRGRKHKNGGGE